MKKKKKLLLLLFIYFLFSSASSRLGRITRCSLVHHLNQYWLSFASCCL
jgi:hypothetical protein